MQKKKIFLILLVAFVVLLAGAGIAYNALKDNVEANNLVTYAPPPADDATPNNGEPSGEQGGEPSGEQGGEPSGEQNENHGHGTNNEQNANNSHSPVLAPDFTVYDKDGKAVKLSDFRGKPVVLNFWASWCSPCQREMPAFNEKYGELGDEILFLMVNLTKNSAEKEKALALIAQKGYTFPVYFDTTLDAAKAYYVSSIPTTYFINAEGHLIARVGGAINAATLMQSINMIK